MNDLPFENVQSCEHDLPGGLLGGIVERRKLCRAVFAAERAAQYLVAERRIFRQERAVAVGAEHVFVPHALRAVLAVVAVAAQHRAERRERSAEARAPAVVFKPDNDAAAGRFTEPVGIIADEPVIGAFGRKVQNAGIVAPLPGGRSVAVAQKLIPAADAEKRFPVLRRGTDVLRAPGAEIRKKHGLFKVLPAADEEKVIPGEIVFCAERQLRDGAADAAPFQPLFHARDVAPVAVKIEHVRVQMADVQFHYSQNLPPPASADSLSRTVSMDV